MSLNKIRSVSIDIDYNTHASYSMCILGGCFYIISITIFMAMI